MNPARAYRRWRRRRMIAAVQRELGPDATLQDATLETLRREVSDIFGVPAELLVHDDCECFPVIDLQTAWDSLPPEVRAEARAAAAFIEYPPDGGPSGEAAEFTPAPPHPDPPTTWMRHGGVKPTPDRGPTVARSEYEGQFIELCHGDHDGECHWAKCPQLADGEPVRSGRHCPLDLADEDGVPQPGHPQFDGEASELGRGIGGF